MSNKRLLNEFSFGFELEGTYDNRETNPSYLKDKFDSMLGGIGNMHGDGSIRCDYGYSPFEYASPVITFTPKNIEKVVKFLDSLPRLYVSVNRSCGFHTHISYTGINRNEVSWLMASMASDETYKDFMKMGRTNFHKGPYARATFFNDAHNYLLRHNFNGFCNTIVTNEKYRSMRIHPQGTIEWRGPRTFLNVNKHAKNVAFMKKLTQFIIKINNTLDLMETPLISKKDFLNRASYKISNLTFRDDIINSDKFKILLEKLKTRPDIINHLSDAKFTEFENYLKNTGTSVSMILDVLPSNTSFKINTVRSLKFFYSFAQIRSFIRFVDADLFKENISLVGDLNKLTPTFEFLIKNENVNDDILNILTRETLTNFGKANIRTFTFNAMKEMIKYNINAFKVAIDKDLIKIFGELRARDLINSLVKLDQYGFKNSEIFNSLMNSVNKPLVSSLFPEVSSLNNVIINNVINESNF